MTQQRIHISNLEEIVTPLEAIVAAGEVTTIDITAIGATDDARVTDPDVADATVIGLLRGILAGQVASQVTLEAIQAGIEALAP